MDTLTANEFNRSLEEHFREFPELKKQINFVGTCQERNRLIREKAKAYYQAEYEKKHRKENPDLNDELLKIIAESEADMEADNFMQDFQIKPKTYAQSFCRETEIDLKEFFGISINEGFGNNYEKFTDSIKNDAKNQHTPVCCDSIKSIIDHEFGHQLDNLLDLKYNRMIGSAFEEFENNLDKMREKLSGYALKGFIEGRYEYKYSEPVAEAWSEYRNSPEPRETAEKIGQITKQLYDEKFKKGSE